MSDKPIDLGKLQDAAKSAELKHEAALRSIGATYVRMISAQRAFDSEKKKVHRLKEILDNAKSAMLEGARTVANN